MTIAFSDMMPSIALNDIGETSFHSAETEAAPQYS
jgi:hypothetical protein